MEDKALSYCHLANAQFLEGLYLQYKNDESSVDLSLRHFFEGLELGMKVGREGISSFDLKVYAMVEYFRTYGHLHANINPVANAEEIKPPPTLESFGFSSANGSDLVSSFGVVKEEKTPLLSLFSALQKIYCSSIGVEYPVDRASQVSQFMQKQIEAMHQKQISQEEKMHLFEDLVQAESFETFLHTRYVGQKRFSLEGAETLLPMLSALLSQGQELEVAHAVIGMAHRGRLNVLANLLGKPYEEIFREFDENSIPADPQRTGDVKYHKGFQTTKSFAPSKTLSITLCPNPSHLESVDPVVEGWVKGVQEGDDPTGKKALAILIHGDASLSGQGVVYETLQLSQVEGYKTGGTIHIVVNNQIGFTTTPKESRSTPYCTDIAKSFGAPVFHVNAEDPIAACAVARLSMQLRCQFGVDVFIDLCGYRRWGHNEGDEPSFTQPLLYERIRSKKTIKTLLKDRLIQEGVATSFDLDQKESKHKDLLKSIAEQMITSQGKIPDESISQEEAKVEVPKISVALCRDLARIVCTPPASIRLHSKIKRLFEERLTMFCSEEKKGQSCIDWGAAEMLFFSSILHEGFAMRLSGQDCQRGTFSQRHAVWVDQLSGEKYCPLQRENTGAGRCTILNSPLSEYAVLGFELGYSLAKPACITLWEAQYGDFANTAQVIIDQYISSLEQKWGQRSSLILLLPHGYEGQGPEHSSARMERYLQLCAQKNLTVALCSTPSQYFHLLRRQAYLQHKCPLIVFTPKALLRHPRCLSSLQELTEGAFCEVILDSSVTQPRKVIFCSGKIYWDLVEERQKRAIDDVALLRIEQLYPFPTQIIASQLDKYKGSCSIVFAQEEHENMGPFSFVQGMMAPLLQGRGSLQYVGRPPAAATAAGSSYLHKKQQQKLMDEAFA